MRYPNSFSPCPSNSQSGDFMNSWFGLDGESWCKVWRTCLILSRVLTGLGAGGREGKGCEILKVGERTIIALWDVWPLIKPTGLLSSFLQALLFTFQLLFRKRHSYFGIQSYEFHRSKILVTTIATPTPQRKPGSYPIVVWPFPRLSPWQPLVLCLIGLFILSFSWHLDFPSIFQTIPLSSLP